MLFFYVDINECSSAESCCTQLCTNLPGSYQCSCKRGFMLDADRCTCIGKSLEMIITIGLLD